MSCCGQMRTGTLARAENPAVPVIFEYVGKTALKLVGPATGASYHFDRPGARLGVHPRDGAELVSVPVLRRVSGR